MYRSSCGSCKAGELVIDVLIEVDFIDVDKPNPTFGLEAPIFSKVASNVVVYSDIDAVSSEAFGADSLRNPKVSNAYLYYF